MKGLVEKDPKLSQQGLPEDVPVHEYPKGLRLVLIMIFLMLGTTLMALDATIISVVTPKITTQFKVLGDIGWYDAAYSMVLTAFTPVASNFYKYFNPKYVYLAFMVVFEGRRLSYNLGKRC